MSKQMIRLSKRAIRELTNSKPVLYIITSNNGTNIYTGTAKRGELKDTLATHFYGQENHVPGARVKIFELSSIKDARDKAKEIIEQEQPKYNLA
ncbi:MAG: hypothetical protein FH749_07140 [Firmicutes bacterium]|nr:hypothetical protein [Bacillota bacterium]